MIGVPLRMARENLDGIPQFGVPPGFALRWYEPGDEKFWLRIHLQGDKLNRITLELFEQQFGGNVEALRTRQCYILNAEGERVGTGTAWFNDNFEGKKNGRIHWVALLPEYEGKGLGKALMTVLCERLRALGHERAYLSTSSARVRAISLYLRFGFVPLVRAEREEHAWKEVLKPG